MKPQELTIKVIFKVEHTPATPDHLKEILRAELKSRGITLRDDLTIEV